MEKSPTPWRRSGCRTVQFDLWGQGFCPVSEDHRDDVIGADQTPDTPSCRLDHEPGSCYYFLLHDRKQEVDKQGQTLASWNGPIRIVIGLFKNKPFIWISDPQGVDQHDWWLLLLNSSHTCYRYSMDTHPALRVCVLCTGLYLSQLVTSDVTTEDLRAAITNTICNWKHWTSVALPRQRCSRLNRFTQEPGSDCTGAAPNQNSEYSQYSDWYLGPPPTLPCSITLNVLTIFAANSPTVTVRLRKLRKT